LAQGMTPEQARNAAFRSLGGFAQIQEECRDMRRTNQIETVKNDLLYAVRTLRRTPGFTIAIVLTMALSVGANTAIFSVIEGVLLRPLPYPGPDRLIRIYLNSDHHPEFPLNPNDFRDFRSQNHTFDGMAGMTRSDRQLSGVGEPVMLRGFRVTAGYFNVLGFSPAAGREFTEEDELPARGRLAILSDHLWRTRFQSDPGVIGRSITLDAEPFSVVGIMPPAFRHPGNTYHAVSDGDTIDLWTPFTFDNPQNRSWHYMDAVGRLKPGVSLEQANVDLSGVLSQLASANAGDRGWRMFLVPLFTEMVARARHMLLILLGAVGLVLLIACVNAANLLLARSTARGREIAIRSALGAARSRIVRQLLTESLVVAFTGAAVGTALAFVAVRALIVSLPAGFPRVAEIRLDSGVFGFTLAIAVVTGLLFGLAPAVAASRADLRESLHEGGRSASAGGRQLRLRSLLVAGETGLACVLLIAAGLMLHSFVNLLRSDPGFRPGQVLTATISLPHEQYKTETDLTRFCTELNRGFKEIPGIAAAGIGSDLPWTGYDENIDGFLVEGRPPEYSEHTSARFHVASADFFQALGVPLLHGRFFTDHDDTKGLPVIIVNDSMAKRYWPGEDAVGKRISFSDTPQEKDWFSIVGVVGDIKDEADDPAARPAFWWPLPQQPLQTMSVALHFDS
ncbi:MAG TPA: ABC transporter permease, partial [Blastocatellia bacterium]|nr:ABC transporter permease [Blastocatellia bacterium]